MDNFLEKYNLPRLTQEETKNRNRPITSNKIEAVIKNYQRTKPPKPDGFTLEFYQTYREDVKPILIKVFQKNTRGGNTPKLIL